VIRSLDPNARYAVVDWPKDTRDPRVPGVVWDNVSLRSSENRDLIEILCNHEVYGHLSAREVASVPDIAALVRRKIIWHYLSRRRPELIVC
jgi:hypothetical protein